MEFKKEEILPLIKKLVWKNERLRNDLTDIISEYVKDKWFKFIEENKTSDFVVFESAIIFERGLETNFDHIIVVTADPAVRLSRVISRNPELSPDEINQRMLTQLNYYKSDKIGLFINNNETGFNYSKHKIKEQIIKFLQENKK